MHTLSATLATPKDKIVQLNVKDNIFGVYICWLLMCFTI